MNAVGAADGDRRQVLQVDLEHRQIGFRVAADDPRQGFAAVLEGHHDLIGTGSHVVVGQQVAFRAHDHRRAQARLPAPLLGQVVAEETAELRVFEQRVGGLVDHFGGVQVGYRRGRNAHCVGIGHRALHDARGLWCLLQVDVLAGQADPLRKTLDDQQGD
ncbi:hypothetical protein D3C80_1087460 [compost metagenome]